MGALARRRSTSASPSCGPTWTAAASPTARTCVEPDCAVRDAVERGDVSAARYESYIKLRDELEDEQPAW